MNTAKPKISTIYPALENMLTVKTNSTIPTFLNHRNASNTTLICVAHGLPIPNLKCQTTSGAKLNASFTTHSDGVISAVLTMNELLSVTAVQCVALSSETGMDNQTVWIEKVTDSIVQETREPSHTTELLTNFVARLLLKNPISYCDYQSVSGVLDIIQFILDFHLLMQVFNNLQQEMNQILHNFVFSRISQFASNSITINSTSCSREVPGAVVIKGHIETQDPTMSERVFRSLDEWRRARPIIFTDNSWATLDQNCVLLAPDNTSHECIEFKTRITINTSNSIPFYVLVGVFCLILLIFLVAAIITAISCRWQRAQAGYTEEISVLPL